MKSKHNRNAQGMEEKVKKTKKREDMKYEISETPDTIA
jgi:hypothetical protein